MGVNGLSSAHFSTLVKIIFVSLLLVGVAKAADEILLGTTTAISGPAKFLGKSMVRGIEAHLHEVNQTGGIDFGGGQKRQLKLITLDDSYHPESAKKNMLRLIDEHQVLSVIGNVGTPTAKETIPLANEHGVLLFATFSGANILRESPPDRYVINYRASYEEEMEKTINAILAQGISGDEIAFFTQRDAYGDAGYQAALKALDKAGFKHGRSLAHGRYTRNTLNVEDGLLTILRAESPPRAIVMVGTYKPSAKFINLARDVFPNAMFFNLSFIGAEAFADELTKWEEASHAMEINGKGELSQNKRRPHAKVYVSQVVPAIDCDKPGIKRFCEAMKAYDKDAKCDSVALEGYWSARIMVEAIKKAGPEVDRESLIDAMESISELHIGNGDTVSFSKKDHQASHKVWLTKYQDGRFVSVSWDKL